MHRIQPQHTANPTLFIVRRHDRCLKNLTFVVADIGPSLPIRNTRVDQEKTIKPCVCEHLTTTVWCGQMAGCLDLCDTILLKRSGPCARYARIPAPCPDRSICGWHHPVATKVMLAFGDRTPAAAPRSDGPSAISTPRDRPDVQEFRPLGLILAEAGLYQILTIVTPFTVVSCSLARRGARRGVVWATTRRPPHERGNYHRDWY